MVKRTMRRQHDKIQKAMEKTSGQKPSPNLKIRKLMLIQKVSFLKCVNSAKLMFILKFTTQTYELW